MPSKTLKQHQAMAIACHHPGKSRSRIPRDVACEYTEADRGRHFPKKRPARKGTNRHTRDNGER